MACDPISWLTGDLLWNVLIFLEGPSLAVSSCARRDLLTVCDRACLHVFLRPLNLDQRGLKRRLSADSHVLRRLCPPGVTMPNSKALQQVLARLSRLAPEGDFDVISSILPWIEHGDLSTRAAAVRAVSKVALKGDRGLTQLLVVKAILGRLRDPILGGSAMEAAIEALQHVAYRGDPDIIAHIQGLLGNADYQVRHAALQALPSVVLKGDEAAIDMILTHMDDKDHAIREVAMRSLGKVAHGNTRAMTRIIGGLQDESVYVRQAALESLPP
ncbi:unnamed protein product [Polarella glacialis]|uniref:HEAT repeat domain-containing protein n=1 Tax=Polarella glacialis TaxID=89957 RepID=A0A813KT55_POLGL|nr:unnamed protein product [Polarella glacialis]|mmetsp:Transcript_35693/g.57500  ORF Transcript_35693/g.57500 Transcript_35693/m.57500 type:complete len:272 (+) Transcript_35693:130-945(+)